MKFKVSDFVNAVPMTHGDYSKVRGWSPPDVPDEPGYLIERKIDGVEANVPGYTGHVTWMTAVTFNRNYSSEDMDFGRALDALRCVTSPSAFSNPSGLLVKKGTMCFA